ncbi:methyltransferase N6AMT1 [Glossina fuscipes]|uniref:Methyltransferase HEMK2 n=1 Tax=Glossina fuscipes TaxID=7396 RepID=A0A8U0WEF1_9MUSC|nr:methyltransferase N6AMT1 [Glossina fuscipes]
METPYIDHLSDTDYENIYEPSQDSFLLLDALEIDLKFIEQELNPNLCLEIGPGSGIIITALSKRLSSSTLCLAVDINRYAACATKRTAQRNGVEVECICGNLVDNVRCNLIDLLLFNPPYVVTADEEIRDAKSKLVHSWAGGKHGRRIIDTLLVKLPEILSPRGVLYLLLLKENKPEEVMQALTKLGFKSEKLIERRIPGEYLYVLKVRHRL